MTTANEITDGAYRLCGIFTPDSDQDTFGLLALNQLMALWGTGSLIQPYETRETDTLVQGTSSYTIGTGGTFNTARPIEVISAFVKDSDNQEYPIDVNMTWEEYSEVTNKSVQGRPTRLFYDPQYTLGKIYFDPNPNAAYTFNFSSRKHLTEFAAIGDTMALPPEYAKALRFALAVDLAPEVNVVLDQVTLNMASAAFTAIENNNAGPVPWANLDPAISYGVYR